MPREKECFRDNLERISNAFPGKEILTKRDVISFTGRGYYFVSTHFKFNGSNISKVELARQMCI